jgi:hypothetical protein
MRKDTQLYLIMTSNDLIEAIDDIIRTLYWKQYWNYDNFNIDNFL